MTTSKAWLTTGQAADLLGVHPETVRQWFDTGTVFRPDEKMRTLKGHRRIRADGVKRVLAEQRGLADPGDDPPAE